MPSLSEIGGFIRRIFTSAGDLLVGTSGGGYERLPIGTADQVLTVNATADGLEWAAAAGGGITEAEAIAAVAAEDDYLLNTGDTGSGAYVLTSTLNVQGAVDLDAGLNVDGLATLNLGLAANGSALFESTIIQDVDSTAAMAVRKEDNTNVFVVNTTGKEVQLRNGTDLRGFSDDGTTETYSIDGATGNIQTDGSVTIAGFPIGLTVTGVTTFNQNTAINNTDTSAFAVRDTLNANKFIVDTTNSEVELRNGSDLRGFSDDGTTEKWSIDGATGNIQHDGSLSVGAGITTQTGSTFLADLAIAADSTSALSVLDSGFNTAVQVDTSSNYFMLANGIDLRGFSDEITTEKWSIIGSTGNIQTDGLLTLTDRTISVGAGSPEGVVTAPIGSLYLRNNGSTGTTLYIKESGVGNTGWVAVSAGGSGISQETAYDTIHASILGGTNLTALIDDGADTVTLNVDDAFLSNGGDTGSGDYNFIGGAATTIFKIDTLNDEIYFPNGAALRGYTDNEITEKWSIGSSGAIQADSNIRSETDFLIGSNSILVETYNFIIDGGGSTITTGIKGDISIGSKGTITGVRLLADQSGSIVVDLWKDTYANYPPVVGDSITASAKPTISSATKSEDTTLTGWTTSVAAGDTIRVNVDSITTCTRVTLALTVKRVV